MPVTTTPLGFKKPDGNELVRGGDNVISDNAQKAEDLIAATQTAASVLAGRVNTAESAVTGMDTRVGSFESQIAGLSAQVASVATPFNIGIDLDGVPYYSDGASGLSLEADTDGVPYFL